MKKIVIMLLILLLPIAALTAQGEQEAETADEFPTKPIDLVVAYGAGGGTDVTARLLADPLGDILGQPVVVRNITGAGGWTGWYHTATAEPDGYTIGYVNVPHIFTHYNDPEAGIDASLDSWNFLTLHVADPCIWAVKGDDDRFNTVEDVVNYAKNNPGELTANAHGFGGDEWLAIQRMQNLTGIELDLIHNNGTSESVSQLLGGHIDVLGANVGEVLRYVESGEMKLLGVMWDSRSEYYPDTPTFMEQGYDVVMFAGRNIATPPGVPQEISDKIQQAVIDATNLPESREAMDKLALTADLRSGEALREFLLQTEQMVLEIMDWD
jgi:tripartite-type tricarboxylate transporter receptor subunit TctC